MSGVEIKKVKLEDDGMRLNRWFLKYYPNLTLGRFQKLLRTKQIKVDGRRAEASLKLISGQEIRIPPLNEEMLEQKRSEIAQKDRDFIRSLVVYKDNNILVINKPSGLAVQGGTNTSRHVDGMLEALCFDKPEKPRLVHRIDKDTSGILVLARTRTAADLLTKAFREHTLQKTYLALTSPAPAADNGDIKAPLQKIGEKVCITPDGKPAHTHYRVIDRVGEKFALLMAEPLTGRTHQIRAHLEHIGTPIVGDNRYFGGSKREKFSLLSDKLHLHAYQIDLSSLFNKSCVITAPLPEHFLCGLQNIGIKFKG